jgi:hypothetical protein
MTDSLLNTRLYMFMYVHSINFYTHFYITGWYRKRAPIVALCLWIVILPAWDFSHAMKQYWITPQNKHIPTLINSGCCHGMGSINATTWSWVLTAFFDFHEQNLDVHSFLKSDHILLLLLLVNVASFPGGFLCISWNAEVGRVVQ